jgi:hypothetical protein
MTRVEFVDDTGRVLGWVQADGEMVTADAAGEEMLTSSAVAGLSRPAAVTAYAGGWSNGYVHTRVVGGPVREALDVFLAAES